MITPRQLRLYLRVWLRLASLQFSSQLAGARGTSLIFILGKLLRFAFAFVLLYAVVGRSVALAGYSLSESVLILAFFNLLQTLNQLLFRGVYLFRQKVQDGTFDFYLLSPLSELFLSLFSYLDPLDLVMLLPYTFVLGAAWLATGYPVTLALLTLVLVVLLLSLLMCFALHVFVISVGVRYLEVDNTIMLYRDLEKMAAFPINLYGRFGSVFMTYVLPFGLMATVPANLVFGLAKPSLLILLTLLAVIEVKLALMYWHSSLKVYSSASS